MMSTPGRRAGRAAGRVSRPRRAPGPADGSHAHGCSSASGRGAAAEAVGRGGVPVLYGRGGSPAWRVAPRRPHGRSGRRPRPIFMDGAARPSGLRWPGHGGRRGWPLASGVGLPMATAGSPGAGARAPAGPARTLAGTRCTPSMKLSLSCRSRKRPRPHARFCPPPEGGAVWRRRTGPASRCPAAVCPGCQQDHPRAVGVHQPDPRWSRPEPASSASQQRGTPTTWRRDVGLPDMGVREQALWVAAQDTGPELPRQEVDGACTT